MDYNNDHCKKTRTPSIFGPWCTRSYAIAFQPIKIQELQYTMIASAWKYVVFTDIASVIITEN